MSKIVVQDKNGNRIGDIEEVSEGKWTAWRSRTAQDGPPRKVHALSAETFNTREEAVEWVKSGAEKEPD